MKKFRSTCCDAEVRSPNKRGDGVCDECDEPCHGYQDTFHDDFPFHEDEE